MKIIEVREFFLPLCEWQQGVTVSCVTGCGGGYPLMCCAVRVAVARVRCFAS